ncbi:putative RNA methyltransferase [Aerococcaceae bacterium WGS1372]
MTKKNRTKHWLENHSNLELACIYCSEVLELQGERLVCLNNHSFDLAKQGYYFMAKKANSTKYDNSLFQSRREIILHTDLYRPLHEYLAEYLKSNVSSDAMILDAGSGEASHLFQIKELIADQNYGLIATDLAKDAIRVATDYNGYLLSMIADLAELPIGDRQIDVILSIFSPSNYAEFERVLKDNGELIKVVPNAAYLQEIRQALIDMGVGNIHPYSNDDVVNVFKKHYKEYSIEEIKQTVQLTELQLKHLITMTPLTWQLTSDQERELLSHFNGQVTLDVSVLIGKIMY